MVYCSVGNETRELELEDWKKSKYHLPGYLIIVQISKERVTSVLVDEPKDSNGRGRL